MEKPAETQYLIHNLLRRRWSPRAFSDRAVEREKICRLLEAARWAASSFNEQPWRFIIATKEDDAEHQRMVSCLSRGNQSWAPRAPVLILSVAKLYFRDDLEASNRHAFHDVGLAVANLIVQATDMDLFVHQMAGFDREKAREVYGLPGGYEPVAMIAVGYAGDVAQLPDDLREKEEAQRVRKPLRDFVFMGHWGKTSLLVTD